MCCQARVRAGIVNEASDVSAVELPLDTLECRRDDSRHSSNAVLSITHFTHVNRVILLSVLCQVGSRLMTNYSCCHLLHSWAAEAIGDEKCRIPEFDLKV